MRAESKDSVHVAVVLFQRPQVIQVPLEGAGDEAYRGQLSRHTAPFLLPAEGEPQGLRDVLQHPMLNQRLLRNIVVSHRLSSGPKPWVPPSSAPGMISGC